MRRDPLLVQKIATIHTYVYHGEAFVSRSKLSKKELTIDAIV